MKITYKLLSVLALLGAAAFPARAGVLANFNGGDVGVDPATGNTMTEPNIWAHDPTVTVSHYTLHGAVTPLSSASPFLYKDWGTTLNPANYVGFTITPLTAAGVTATSADFQTNPYFGSSEGIGYYIGYRVNDGSGFGPWVFSDFISNDSLIANSHKPWVFPAPVTTHGVLEIGCFGIAPTTPNSVNVGGCIVQGTAGDTTRDPSLVGVIHEYTDMATFDCPTSEASAITYNWDTDSLFAVGDEGASIVEITKTGKVKSNMGMTQGKFKDGLKGDPEALSYAGRGQDGLGVFMIGAERENVGIFLKYHPDSYDDPQWMKSTPAIVFGPTNGNIGLEGVSVDSREAGSVWGIKEKQPTAIFHATNVGSAGQALTPLDMNDITWRLGTNSLSDIFVMSNSAAYATSDHLLVLARDQQKVIEITKTGLVVDTLDISKIGRSTIEGLTMDNDGVVYLCSEGVSSIDPRLLGSGLHVLSKPKAQTAGTGGRQTITGTAAADTIRGNQAADTLTGGAGADTFVYKTLRDGIDTITDFTPGTDVLDFTELLASVGYKGTTYQYLPLTDGTVRAIDSADGALVQVKSAGVYRTMVVLRGLTAAQASAVDNFRFQTATLGN